jgi:hypothetical protein
MTAQSPAAQLEARANREHTKLLKAQDELQMLAGVIKHCDLPSEIKLRLYGALRVENDLLTSAQERIAGLRKAAEISRSKQWVTSGDER